MVHVTLAKPKVMQKLDGRNIIIQLKVQNHQNTVEAISTTILHGLSFQMLQKMLQTPKKEVHFFFFSVRCIDFICSWQLIVFDKKQKSYVKRIHLVTDYGLYDRKALYTVKVVFYSCCMNDGKFINYKTGYYLEL